MGEAEIDVFLNRPSMDASPIRKARYLALGNPTEAEMKSMNYGGTGITYTRTPGRGTSREEDSQLLEGLKKKWKPPIELQLMTLRGIRLWWRARQWLSLDVRDERATMEMLLTFSLTIMALIGAGSFVWYVVNDEVTLVMFLSMYAAAVLLVFIILSLNKCIEVNELMMNDSLMLANMRYYLANRELMAGKGAN